MWDTVGGESAPDQRAKAGEIFPEGIASQGGPLSPPPCFGHLVSPRYSPRRSTSTLDLLMA